MIIEENYLQQSISHFVKEMTSKKCIYRAQGEGSDESESLITPCFQIGLEVQLRDIPTSGEEYLLKVIKERQKCTVVTKCDQDYSKFAKNQSCFVKEVPHAKAPDKLKPTIEWQNIQVADFSDVRMYISRVLANKTLWPSNLKTEVRQNYLMGWKTFFETREPTLSCVLGFRHIFIERGLEMLIEILKEVRPGDTIDHKTGQWIYAFLACTRQPLLSDTTSILRNLARQCAKIRSRVNQDDENAVAAVAPLNIFICLVAQYFRQYDLAD